MPWSQLSHEFCFCKRAEHFLSHVHLSIKMHYSAMYSLILATVCLLSLGRTGSGVETSSEITTQPSPPVAGTPFNLTILFRAENGTVIPKDAFVIGHERLLHLVMLGADLDTFTHIHFEDLGPRLQGQYAIRVVAGAHPRTTLQMPVCSF
jgi:hypothetical protein